MKKDFKIYGMMCAACAAHVEHAVSMLPSVSFASVSLLTAKMSVEFEGEVAEILAAVKRAGYRAKEIEAGETETLALGEKTRFFPIALSLLLSIVIMYFEMGHMRLPYPTLLLPQRQPILYLSLLILLTAPIVFLNRRYFIGGWRSLLSRAPNMDTLIALGAGAAIVYGLCIFFAFLFFSPDASLAMKAPFASAAMILALVSLGKALEGHAKDKTADAVRALARLMPDTARVQTAEGEKMIAASDLTTAHILILKAGDSIPCDGRVLEGFLSVDESALTGESLPVEKGAGGGVFAGCTVSDGYARIQPTEVGAQTSLSKTVQSVFAAASTKAPIQKTADTISRYFVPAVIAISLMTLAAWLIATKDIGRSLHYAISVLVISCPCALGLATPTAIMCAMGRGAQMGIFIKSAETLEQIGRIGHIIFDKTGTLTEGKMRVLDFTLCEGITKEVLFAVASGIERGSTHPLAAAITEYTKDTEPIAFDKISTLLGKGLFAKNEKSSYEAGNLALMEDCEIETHTFSDFVSKYENQGAAIIYIADAHGPIGAFAIADTPRKDAKHTVCALKEMNLSVSMLTGDALAPAQRTALALGIEDFSFSLCPEEKSEAVRKISEQGGAMMVGDGINDCLPLVQADVGVAIGSGSDIALESADVVIRGEETAEVLRLIRLGRFTLRKIKQNLFWALLYNCICIPLAAGILAPIGISLSPMIASAAMACSSLCVVGNALTIRFYK